MKSISGKKFAKLLESKGWSLLRVNGSHHIDGKPNNPKRISVPIHGNKALKTGLLKHFLKVADLSKDELLAIAFIIITTPSISKMSQLTVITEHIEITPGVCGGKPRIAGHRIKVQDIVIWHEKMGMSPDEIVSEYPSINLSDVYAALAYYHDRLAEIRHQIEEDEEYAKRLKSQTPSLIQQKLKNLDGK